MRKSPHSPCEMEEIAATVHHPHTRAHPAEIEWPPTAIDPYPEYRLQYLTESDNPTFLDKVRSSTNRQWRPPPIPPSPTSKCALPRLQHGPQSKPLAPDNTACAETRHDRWRPKTDKLMGLLRVRFGHPTQTMTQTTQFQQLTRTPCSRASTTRLRQMHFRSTS